MIGYWHSVAAHEHNLPSWEPASEDVMEASSYAWASLQGGCWHAPASPGVHDVMNAALRLLAFPLPLLAETAPEEGTCSE